MGLIETSPIDRQTMFDRQTDIRTFWTQSTQESHTNVRSEKCIGRRANSRKKGDSHLEIQMDKLRGVHIDRRETDCSVMKSRLTDRRSKKCVDRRKDRHW